MKCAWGPSEYQEDVYECSILIQRLTCIKGEGRWSQRVIGNNCDELFTLSSNQELQQRSGQESTPPRSQRTSRHNPYLIVTFSRIAI